MQDQDKTRQRQKENSTLFGFSSIFLGENVKTTLINSSHISFGSNPFPPQKKFDNGGFEPGSSTRPSTSGCRAISPFTASAWERVGIEKEFKYTYLQFTYTTAWDTNGNSNVSWVWYLGVLTCIVNKLVCANSDDTVEVREHYAAITSLSYTRIPHFGQKASKSAKTNFKTTLCQKSSKVGWRHTHILLFVHHCLLWLPLRLRS